MDKSSTLIVLRDLMDAESDPFIRECLRTAIDELKFAESWSNGLTHSGVHDRTSLAINDIWHMSRAFAVLGLDTPSALHAYFESVDADADFILQKYHWALTHCAEVFRQELDARQIQPLPAESFD